MEKKTPTKQNGNQATIAQFGIQCGLAPIIAAFPPLPGIFVQLDDTSGWNRVRQIVQTDNIEREIREISGDFARQEELTDKVWYVAAPVSADAERQAVVQTLLSWIALPA